MLLFCKEFYDILTRKPEEANFRLTFAPNQKDIDDRYFYVNEKEHIEVICFKGTYLSIFKECHNYLPNFTTPSMYPLSNLLYLMLLLTGITPLKDWMECDVFYATIGYLLTTPENKAAINLHLDILTKKLNDPASSEDTKIDLLKKEISLFSRLLTSSNNKLNKSSSLWCFYRKLYLLLKDRRILLKYCPVMISSASRHFSNYYCWETVRWFFDVVTNKLEKTDIYKFTLKFCLQNTQDSSSWSALSYMVCQSKKKNDFNYQDCIRLQKKLGCRERTIQTFSKPIIDPDDLANTLIESIDTLTIEDWPPFLCLDSIFSSFTPKLTIKGLRSWKCDVKKLELKYGPIEFIRNNPIVPENISDDFMVSRTWRSTCYKKRLIQNLLL